MLEQFLGIVGVFSLVDVLIDKRRKAEVAWFIFGFSDLSFNRFEYSVIQGFIGIFIYDGRLSWRRVAVFSAVLSVAFAAFMIASSKNGLSTAAPMQDFAKLTASMLFTTLIDFAVLHVLKAVFWRRRYHPAIQSLLALATPILLITPILAAVASVSFAAGAGALPWVLVLTAAILWLPSMLLISAVQVSTCLLGLALRGALMLTRLNRYTVLFIQAHDVPFTFLGVLAGLSWLGLTRLLQT